MVIPVGPDTLVQEFLKIDRIKGEPSSDANQKVDFADFDIESVNMVRYVPLIPPTKEF